MFRMKAKDDPKKDDKDPKKPTEKKSEDKKADKPAPKSEGKPAPKPAPKAASAPVEEPIDDADDLGAVLPEMPEVPEDAGLPEDMGAPTTDVTPLHLHGKLSQFGSGYLGPENGPFRCGNCRHFDGQSTCEIVDGDIHADGVCSVFEPTDNPAGMVQAPPDLNAIPNEPVEAPDAGQVAGITSPADLEAQSGY